MPDAPADDLKHEPQDPNKTQDADIAAKASEGAQEQLGAEHQQSAGQTGPAQGLDPAVGLQRVETDEEQMIEPETTTGPAQEPVHRQTPHAADPDAMAWEAEHNPQPEPTEPDEAAELTEADMALLLPVLKRVHETQGREQATDSAGRTWDFAYQVMNNQAVIVMQGQRTGFAPYTTTISCSMFGVEDDDVLSSMLGNAATQVK